MTAASIFEEFHQINNPARERSKGLGLGLAIVQRLSNLLGHSIDLKSWPGHGSMFSIVVPIEAPTCVASVPTQQSSNGLHAKGNGSILVVEDDPAIRELLGDASDRGRVSSRLARETASRRSPRQSIQTSLLLISIFPMARTAWKSSLSFGRNSGRKFPPLS